MTSRIWRDEDEVPEDELRLYYQDGVQVLGPEDFEPCHLCDDGGITGDGKLCPLCDAVPGS